MNVGVLVEEGKESSGSGIELVQRDHGKRALDDRKPAALVDIDVLELDDENARVIDRIDPPLKVRTSFSVQPALVQLLRITK